MDQNSLYELTAEYGEVYSFMLLLEIVADLPGPTAKPN